MLRLAVVGWVELSGSTHLLFKRYISLGREEKGGLDPRGRGPNPAYNSRRTFLPLLGGGS